MSGSPLLHVTDVDGVPCFWVASGRPTLTARLGFRFGSADEVVTESGWQHLLEHLCLTTNAGHGDLEINGSVGLHDTTFEAHGTPSAVIAHLRAITQWLSEPNLDSLDHERQVLRAEAATRGRGPVAEALSWRYGVRGPGLIGYGELGLSRAAAPALRARAGDAFVTGNAALALDGPPPSDLVLNLPAGGLRPLARALPVETQPGTYLSDSWTMSGVVQRDGGMFVGTSILQRALETRLRGEAGAAYAPWATYEPIDHDCAVVLAGSDVHEAAAIDPGRTIVAVLDDLVAGAVREAWLAEEISRTVRRTSDPYAVGGIAFAAALRHLHGHQPVPLDQRLDQIRSTTAEQLTRDFTMLRASLLLGSPDPLAASADLPLIEMPETEPHAESVSVRSINWPGDPARLHLHPLRVAVADGDQSLGVALEDVTAYLVYDDGPRRLLRQDGYSLTLLPTWWVDGPKAIAFVDRHIPEGLHLPQPASGFPSAHRLTGFQRWAGATEPYLMKSPVVSTIVVAPLIALASFMLRVAIDQRVTAQAIVWAALFGTIMSPLIIRQARRAVRDSRP